MGPWQSLVNILNPGGYNAETGMMDQGTTLESTGMFNDPAKLQQAQTLWDKIRQQGGNQAINYPLYQQLAELADPAKLGGEATRQGTAFDAAKKAGEWNFDSPLYGMALIGGIGGLANLMGAGAGMGAGGGGGLVDTSLGGGAIDAVGGMGTGVGELGVGGAGSGIDALAGAGAVGTGAAGTAAGAVGTGAAGTAANSILSRIWDGTATAEDFLKLLGPAMSIGSGLYGMSKAGDLEDAAAAAAKTANPWETSGGRGLADAQAQALLKDPTSLLTDPGYKARMMGVERGMASQGYQGSGNMAVAAANASGDFYNQRLALLGGLAGAPGSPVSSAQLNLAGTQAATNLTGQGLASIGYGVTQATGGTTTIPPAVRDYMRSIGIILG